MAGSKSKTLEVARVSIENFFLRHRQVWFITFTQPGLESEFDELWTKDEAEAHFKPFRDLCARRGAELLVVWERQKRGAWHPHCLVSKRFDVAWLRPWMVERGWGRQMRLEHLGRVTKSEFYGPNDPDNWTRTSVPGAKRIVSYLTKYLTKSVKDVDGCEKKKVFCSSRTAKAGGVSFKWVPWLKAGSFLYAAGLEYFKEFEGRRPRFRDMAMVIRLGVEATGWADYDPLWEFGFP